MQLRRRLVLGLALAFTGAPSYAFYDLCVQPDGIFGCFPTIQEAVSAVTEPYTIIGVYPGVYEERIEIEDEERDGTILWGLGRKRDDVTIDAFDDDFDNDDAAIFIAASYVTIGHLAIRNANFSGGDDPSDFEEASEASGVFVDDAEFVTIKDVDIRRTSGSCIVLGGEEDDDASDAKIEDVFLAQCGEDCITIFDADRTRVTHSEMRLCGSDGIDADWPGDVGRNDDLIITDNTIISTDDDGVDLFGDDILVKRNRIKSTGGDGINLVGDLESFDPLAGTEIVGNDIKNADNDGIEANQARLIRIEKNRIEVAGAGGKDDCIDAEELDDSRIEHNILSWCFGDGIWIEGSDNRIAGNVIKYAGDDGIDVNGDEEQEVPLYSRNEVSANRVTGSARSGIEVDNYAEDTAVVRNLSKDNKLDLCVEFTAVNTQLTGNLVGTSEIEEPDFWCP